MTTTRKALVAAACLVSFYAGTLVAIVVRTEWEWLQLSKATERRRRGL